MPRKREAKHNYGVAVFDIETSNLNADFGVILCAALQFSGSSRVHVLSQRTLNPAYAHGNYLDDSTVLRPLLAMLDQATFWVAHNGADFDLPFMQTRAAYWRIPMNKPRALLDPCVVSRRKFKLSSNSLAHLTSTFGLQSKKSLDSKVWQRATLGRDESAWVKIEKHCEKDVRALMGVGKLMRGFWSNLSSTGTFY